MNDKQPITLLDRVTIFLGVAVPLILTLSVSVYVTSLMLSGAFPDYHLTVKLLVSAWVLFAGLCMCFAVAVRRHHLRT